MPETTKVLPCNCDHKYQDKIYGAKMRLHNYGPGLFGGKGGWRCTICRKEKVSDKAPVAA